MSKKKVAATVAKKKVLLAGVFGPYGVDDAFGRRENVMELFHNQVTKAQGVTSFRFHHRSFGLYFIAANIDADVTVLDFPSRKAFIRELSRGYDIVGISFIVPNFVKAKEMAMLTRKHAPKSEIVLGGHGAAIEGVDTLIDCDHVVKGEGIRWFREHLGQDASAPLVHPSLPTTEYQRIVGIPIPGATSSVLVPGVGCVNGCSFCATTHFFGKEYTPFVRSGKELFRLACRIADERGSDVFYVMDENFLKDKQRALELVDEMERHQRFFNFYLFSSAETITSFGIENLVRLGVISLWIGFESKTRQGLFSKNDGIDGKKLVRDLRDHGISVLASGILCMEHHTPENMQEDVDYLVGLESDLVQFMLLLPLPVTALYERFRREGLIDWTVPFEEWHGQKGLTWRHPAFTSDEAEKRLNAAFKQDYEENSSSMYRYCETAVRGYKTLSAMTDRDSVLEARLVQMRARAHEYGLTLGSLSRFAVNDTEKKRVATLERELLELFGPLRAVDRAKKRAVVALTAAWSLRIKLFGDRVQPRTIRTEFTQDGRIAALYARASEVAQELCEAPLDERAAAMSRLR